MSISRRLRFALVSLCFGSAGSFAIAQAPRTPASGPTTPGTRKHRNPALPTLWLLGNPAFAEMPGDLSGRFAAFGAMFDPTKINVLDFSDEKETLRRFVADRQWSALLSEIRPGDFVLIQFAYRSATGVPDADRAGSLPGTSDEIQEIIDPIQNKTELVHTYGWYLREIAVEVIAHGAIPILCSPARQVSVALDPNSDIAWSKAIAIQQRIPFVELSTTAPAAVGEGRAGPPAASARTTVTGVAFAEDVVAGLKALPSDPLAGYFSARGKAVHAAVPPASQNATTPLW